MSSDQIAALRILDAAANRAGEGARVVEDYLRFGLDDRFLTTQCKAWRHNLQAVLAKVPSADRISARETQRDVGTLVKTVAEQTRVDAFAVVGAGFSRVEQAVRSLEEYSKVIAPPLAQQFEQLRYQWYTLEKATLIVGDSLRQLEQARLYVLIDGCESPDAFARLAGSLVEAGVHLLQLRDKQLDDRALLDRARQLRELTRGTETRFIMNDRPDLAALAQADGVHVGQAEVSVKDARSIVGPQALIGVSTHSIEQARQAVLDGANYIGVGPTFPSGTKQFAAFTGLDLLRTVASEIRLPAFAIGGITLDNISGVLATGITRVAVSGAVLNATSPASAAREILACMN